MKWESLNFHFENLVPGITTLALILAFIPADGIESIKNSVLSELLKREAFSIGVFLSVAYVLGILNVAISRAIVDRASEFTLRPIIIRRLARGDLDGHNKETINQKYRNLIGKVLKSGEKELIAEVLKRRERGRMVRAIFFPLLLLVAVVASELYPVWVFISVVAAFLVVLSIYAYVEGTIYEECILFEESTEIG